MSTLQCNQAFANVFSAQPEETTKPCAGDGTKAWGSRPLETSQKGPGRCVLKTRAGPLAEVANGQWPKPCWLMIIFHELRIPMNWQRVLNTAQWVVFPGWLHGQRIETWGPLSWQMAWQVVNLSWSVFPFSTKTSWIITPMIPILPGKLLKPQNGSSLRYLDRGAYIKFGCSPIMMAMKQDGVWIQPPETIPHVLCFSEPGTFNVGNWKICWLVVSSKKQAISKQ